MDAIRGEAAQHGARNTFNGSEGTLPPARLLDEELAAFYDLLSKMLYYLPEERLSIGEVLQHPLHRP